MNTLPRTWTRPMWKFWYRHLRIGRRESYKAFTDAVIHGIGFTRIDVDGIHHVPHEEMYEWPHRSL